MKFSSGRQVALIGALAVLLMGLGALWWQTAPPSATSARKAAARRTAADLVDETTYASAQHLAQLADSAEEKTFTQSALRIADHELDLAFSAALSDVDAHPPVLDPTAVSIQDRIQKSQILLDSDQQRVTALTSALQQSKPSQKEALQDELDIAQSQLELDKDELEEAGQDLTDAGGNPRRRIESMVQEHNAQTQAPAQMLQGASAAEPKLQSGSLGKLLRWLKTRQKRQELQEALDASARKAAELAAHRAALAESLDSAKGNIAELAQHTKTAKANLTLAPASEQPRQHSHEDAASLLSSTKVIAADQKVLSLMDRRISDHHQLDMVYAQWTAVVALQMQVLAHSLFLNALIIVGILVVLTLLDRWLHALLGNPKLDRRQVETLRSISRVVLRVIGVVIILLILIGVPGQLGTMLGIVGAGLTVALKDFIVAFFGWLMLMGRHGIRLGDWVEIDGVSGEVTELGMFHTVLLETGNWSDAGHPTGRRVTFTNSFAIEKHYFNFSTSGQWLWDQLQVVVPAGSDPYPLVDAITTQVTEATAESARQAEDEWRRAVPTSRGQLFSGAPGINVKPVVGGVEVSVRYITRANERFQLRTKLYQAAVDLLSRASAAEPARV